MSLILFKYPILCKIQGFKALYTIKKFVLGGCRGGRSYFYGIVLTRGLIYIENCKTLPIWIVTGL